MGVTGHPQGRRSRLRHPNRGRCALRGKRIAGAVHVAWLAWGCLRPGATTGAADARSAGFPGGAILLLPGPKAHVIIMLMFTQFLPATGGGDPAMVRWITAVFTLDNLVAFTIRTLAGDLLPR